MDKYKININQQLPSKEEIEEKKDFGTVLKSYQSKKNPTTYIKNLHRNKKLIRNTFLFTIAGLALLFSINYFENQNQTKTEEILLDTLKIEIPIDTSK